MECNYSTGSDVIIGIGVQPDNCVVAPEIFYFSVSDLDKGEEITREIKKGITNNNIKGVDLKETDRFSAPTFTLPVGPILSGLMLQAGLPTYAVSGAGPYTHIFTPANNACPTFFTIVVKDNVQTYIIYNAVLDSASLSLAADGDLTWDMTFAGDFPIIDNAFVLGTPVVDTEFKNTCVCAFMAADTATIDADILAHAGTIADPYETSVCINNFNLDIEPDLGEINCFACTEGCGGNKKRYNKDLLVSGNFEVIFDNQALYNMWLNNLQGAIKIRIKCPGSTDELVIDIPTYKINEFSVPYNTDDIIVATIGFNALNISNSGGLIGTVINTIPTYV